MSPGFAECVKYHNIHNLLLLVLFYVIEKYSLRKVYHNKYGTESQSDRASRNLCLILFIQSVIMFYKQAKRYFVRRLYVFTLLWTIG